MGSPRYSLLSSQIHHAQGRNFVPDETCKSELRDLGATLFDLILTGDGTLAKPAYVHFCTEKPERLPTSRVI